MKKSFRHFIFILCCSVLPYWGFGQTATMSFIEFNGLGASTPQDQFNLDCYPLDGSVQIKAKVNLSGFTTNNIPGYDGTVKINLNVSYIASNADDWTVSTSSYEVIEVDDNGQYTRTFTTLLSEYIYSDVAFDFSIDVIPLNSSGDPITSEEIHEENFYTYQLYFTSLTFDLDVSPTNYSYITANNVYMYCNTSPGIDISNSECVAGYMVEVYNSNANGDLLGDPVHTLDWQWDFDGTTLGNTLNISYSLTSGNYYKYVVYGHDANSSSNTETFHIKYNSSSLSSITPGQSNYSTCEGDQVTMTATGSGTLKWYLDAVNVYTGTSYNIPSPVVGQSGTYIIKSSSDCVSDGTTTLTVNPYPEIEITPDLFYCADEFPVNLGDEVSISPSGIGGYPTWSNAGICGLNTSTGAYDPITPNCYPGGSPNHSIDMTFKWTSDAGCLSTTNYHFEWNKNPVPNVSVTDVLCSGQSNGSATSNPSGDNPFTISWTVGSNNIPGASITNQPAGTYTVHVTDERGCVTSEPVVIDEPDPIQANENNLVNAPCSTNSWTNQYGSADIYFSGGNGGPYTFSIDGGAYSGSYYPPFETLELGAGTHNVSVKDVAGCAAGSTGNFVINANSSFRFAAGSPSVTNANCVGVNNGSINVNVAGGTPNYVYEWNPGSGTSGTTSADPFNITGLAANSGDYYVTVTDNNATGECTIISGPHNIGATSNYTASVINPVEATCQGIPDGELSASSTLPSPTYLWSNGASGSTITGLVATTYTVTATGSNGCIATASGNPGNDGADRWQQNSGTSTSAADHAIATAADDQDNIYVLGTFFERTNFGTGTVDCGQLANAFYIVKYDYCGNVEWVLYPDLTSISSIADFVPIDLVISGSALKIALHHDAVGSFNSLYLETLPASSTYGPINCSSGYNTLILTANTLNGTVTSVDQFNSFSLSGNNGLKDMEIDGSTLYVAGRVNNRAKIYSISGSTATQVLSSGQDGNEFMDIEKGSSSWFGVGTKDASASLSFGGSSMSSAAFPEGFILKTNTSFTVQGLTRSFTNECTAVAVELDGSDNPYVAGSTNATFDNMYVVRKDASTLVTDWTSQVNSSTSQASWATASDLIFDTDGRVLLSGSFLGQDIHISANSSNETVTGNSAHSNMYLAAFNSSTGQCAWMLSGSSTADASSVALAKSGYNNYVVGDYRNTLTFSNQSFDDALDHPNNSTPAMFAVRFGTQYTEGQDGVFYKNSETEGSVQTGRGIALYPNPTGGKVSLTWEVQEGLVEISIFDLGGSRVFTDRQPAATGQTSFDMNDRPAGTYFVEVGINGHTWREKLVKF